MQTQLDSGLVNYIEFDSCWARLNYGRCSWMNCIVVYIFMKLIISWLFELKRVQRWWREASSRQTNHETVKPRLRSLIINDVMTRWESFMKHWLMITVNIFDVCVCVNMTMIHQELWCSLFRVDFEVNWTLPLAFWLCTVPPRIYLLERREIFQFFGLVVVFELIAAIWFHLVRLYHCNSAAVTAG